jgi:hypothetical protein
MLTVWRDRVIGRPEQVDNGTQKGEECISNTDRKIENETDNYGSLAATSLQIAEERAEVLAQMRAAILAKDDRLAMRFARSLCGVDDNESKTSH